ncbi:probable coenzyme F420-dependent N5,N10-methylene tetrahydromethanopterin reductase and related flavin-dependent oxidoreductases [Phialocephala subalpina]|uniref:Probable coenzyme F420-dependent N5,N10-methylene tetrahydromethanopterin reductase and related flavin-dependent oxidoreductases n=1 Tax=Phialocephala subalpina TaxID=576137 RepID=A0A1L7WL04_9HELO|nr:probable coenzyme F420-dependent N5,N10-methylene tetrahydromethanopterin reductase and related flavin-dependent oxidoreductases [Phialocephala subalpina]
MNGRNGSKKSKTEGGANSKQLHLTSFMRPVSLHTGAWRYPGSYPDANFNLAHLKSFIKKLEDAKFDAFFIADHLAPFTLLSALSQATKRIGLAATASTTYDEPYHIARRFASLDHISNGRAAWNIVTTGNPDFADDAFIHNQESGIYLDPEKMHVLNHKGDDLQVKGPLNIARPVQGWPVIVQAGQSDPGRQLAAETAEAVFCSPKDLDSAKALYADIKGRAVIASRDRNHLKILPAAFIVIGDTVEEAVNKRLHLDRLVHYDSAISSLSIALGTDASGFDPDGPLPSDLLETNASKTSREGILRLAEGLTVRQLAQRYGGYSGLAFVGTPETIADEMGRWLDEEGCDGFTIVMPFLPQGLDDVPRRLVPELQRRGIFRKEYEGTTLRENLGLPRPRNQFF